jgi:glutamate/tyrosine decarboxylase-like PLP-dependent enzyme
VRGAYDPFNPIADICEKNDMWMHVDGAWGGCTVMSEKYKGLAAGMERADSITFDAHKMLGAPQQCAFLLLKSKDGLPASCNGLKAAYLFQPDKPYVTTTRHKHVAARALWLRDLPRPHVTRGRASS